jgi:hypothetical protein
MGPKLPSEATMARRLAGARRCTSVTLLVVAVALAQPDVAIAQGATAPPGLPRYEVNGVAIARGATAPSGLPRYEVNGFREARFGMTEPQIRMMAKKWFGVDDGDMTATADVILGTTKLIVHVQMLEPGLGQGRVEYVFGYRQHRLFQVNVVWGLDTNPQFNNLEMLTGAIRLMDYFLGFAWVDRSVRIGVPIGLPIDERALLVFGGADERNGAVSLIIQDVRYELLSDAIVRLVPEISTPTKLIISYASGEPDVREITRNEF